MAARILQYQCAYTSYTTKYDLYCSLCSSCENVIPESDDLLCLRCECNYESRNTALIAVSIYMYSGNYYCLTSAISHSIRACGRSFCNFLWQNGQGLGKSSLLVSSSLLVTVSGSFWACLGTYFSLNDWDEWFDSSRFSLVAARSQEMETYEVDSCVHGHRVFQGAMTGE